MAAGAARLVPDPCHPGMPRPVSLVPFPAQQVSHGFIADLDDGRRPRLVLHLASMRTGFRFVEKASYVGQQPDQAAGNRRDGHSAAAPGWPWSSKIVLRTLRSGGGVCGWAEILSSYAVVDGRVNRKDSAS